MPSARPSGAVSCAAGRARVIGSEHLPNDLPRDPKLPADRLDRPLLNEIRPADLRNRLHDQHPELGLHVPWKPVWTLIPGVPFSGPWNHRTEKQIYSIL